MLQEKSDNRIFINRTLNLNGIKLIGFDMDYTIVTYNVPRFEKKAFDIVVEKLIKKGYPEELRQLEFDPGFIIRGLVVDTENGNFLKINLHGYVKKASHGTRFMSYDELKAGYSYSVIELADPRYYIIHTLFSLAEGYLFAKIVDYIDEKRLQITYKQAFNDIHKSLDDAHQEDELKGDVVAKPKEYLIKDPDIVNTIRKLKRFGKKLALITNSDYEYSKRVMDYCFGDYIDGSWQELFDLIVVASNKPCFFEQQQRFFKVDRDNGTLSNFHGPIKWGEIYQGGNAKKVERDLGLSSSDILYIGDHIFGDVVTLKEAIGWRSGLVVQELNDEVNNLHRTAELRARVSAGMIEKEKLEDRNNALKEVHSESSGESVDVALEAERSGLKQKIAEIDNTLSELIVLEQKGYNPFWGEVMRAGNDESRFAMLVERYACIYMASVGNLLNYSPFKFFRSHRRYLPHDPVPGPINHVD